MWNPSERDRKDHALAERSKQLVRRLFGRGDEWPASQKSVVLKKGDQLSYAEMIDLSEYWKAEVSQVHYADGSSELFRGPSANSSHPKAGRSVASDPSRPRDVVRIEHTHPTETGRRFASNSDFVHLANVASDSNYHGITTTIITRSKKTGARIVTITYVIDKDGYISVVR